MGEPVLPVSVCCISEVGLRLGIPKVCRHSSYSFQQDANELLLVLSLYFVSSMLSYLSIDRNLGLGLQ
jgi:hypothetical protein